MSYEERRTTSGPGWIDTLAHFPSLALVMFYIGVIEEIFELVLNFTTVWLTLKPS